MKTLYPFIFTMMLMSFADVNAQSNKAVTDYLKLGGIITFEKQSYDLVWTSHPANNFYKQEYIQKNDAIPKFKTMILVDLITGNNNIK